MVSGETAPPLGAAARPDYDAGRALGILLLAFIAGGLVVFMLMPRTGCFPARDSTSGCGCHCSAAAAYSCQAEVGPSLKADCGSRGSARARDPGRPSIGSMNFQLTSCWRECSIPKN
jgi:hypothetical protein